MLNGATPPPSWSRTTADRLAALGELWAAVDLFHPLVREQRFDWDAAVTEAMPLVAGAEDAQQLRRVVAALLDRLGHSGGAVLDAARAAPDPAMWPSPGGDAGAVALHPLGAGHVLLCTADVEPFATSGQGGPLLERLLAEATAAEGLVLDLRGCSPFLARALARKIAGMLGSSLVLPGVSRCVHLGLDHHLVTPHPVGPAALTTTAVKIDGGPARRLPRLVCIAGRTAPRSASPWGCAPGTTRR